MNTTSAGAQRSNQSRTETRNPPSLLANRQSLSLFAIGKSEMLSGRTSPSLSSPLIFLPKSRSSFTATARNMPTSESIKVAFRVRPLNQKEKQKGSQIATVAHAERGVIEITNPSSGDAKQFTFDHVFGEQSTQVQVYNTVCAPVVQSCLDGYNGTVFCFGQTGAGKVRAVSALMAVLTKTIHITHSRCRAFPRKCV